MAKPGNGSVATSTAEAVGRARPEAVGRRRHPQPHLAQLEDHHLQRRELDARELDLTARDPARHQERARLDAVAGDRGLAGDELLDALDLDGRRSGAVDAGTHAVEEGRQGGDLGLAGGVLDDGGALGERRGAEQVLGRPHRRELQDDAGAGEDGTAGLDVAVPDAELDPHRPEPAEVHVELPASDRVAARERDVRLPTAGDQRPEDVDRGSHAAHQLVGRGGAEVARGVDREGVVADPLDPRADRPEDVDHHVEVAHRREVADGGGPGSEERGGHLLEAVVLRAPGDAHPSRQRRTGAHAERLHRE